MNRSHTLSAEHVPRFHFVVGKQVVLEVVRGSKQFLLVSHGA